MLTFCSKAVPFVFFICKTPVWIIIVFKGFLLILICLKCDFYLLYFSFYLNLIGFSHLLVSLYLTIFVSFVVSLYVSLCIYKCPHRYLFLEVDLVDWCNTLGFWSLKFLRCCQNFPDHNLVMSRYHSSWVIEWDSLCQWPWVSTLMTRLCQNSWWLITIHDEWLVFIIMRL